ncbi:MAG: hypothetical protein QNK03_00745 [Myxococcota bacterium]|nr:hypothetical protein [Myxococcota bacterium]
MARARPEPRRRFFVGPGSVGALRSFALLWAAFTALALWVYAPAFDGPFVSDDLHYVATNPYVHELSPAMLAAIWNPTSAATVFVVNYSPVQLTVHNLAWQAFGESTTGHHVINVLLHALGSALLVWAFADAGLALAAAVLGGLLFLLHPANVEAVAWVSQLKTSSAFALAMGALLLHPRRPGWGALAFALALLAKPTAAFALPVAFLLDFARRDRIRWRWLALWTVLLASFAVVEFWTHQRSGAAEPIHPDALVRLRTIVGFAARYLWMSATSLGVSAFHEPGPSPSWLDPWWWSGLALLVALGWRALHVLRRTSPEVAFWAWAAVSFVPVSQVFPFLHPLADRYLYFILPGLLGGTLFMAIALGRRRLEPGTAARAGRAALAAGLVLAALFGARAHARAQLWKAPARLMADAALHYPDGRAAHVLRARRAVQRGDTDAAIEALRAAWERGFNRFEQLQNDPAFARLSGDPRFRALIREIAGWWVTQLQAKPAPTQIELRTLAIAHLARNDRERAIRALERAIETGGPLDDRLEQDLEQVRRKR